jgi:hypothetical protein
MSLSDVSEVRVYKRGVEGINVPDPVVNLSFADESANVIPNIGTGGNQYNATVVDYTPSYGGAGSHETNDSGFVLNNHSYANVNYPLSKNESFTICVRGGITAIGNVTYQRLFRTDKDAPSVYYSYQNKDISAKLSGSSGTLNVCEGVVAQTNDTRKTAYIPSDYISVSQMHSYVFVGDASLGLISYYFDGELMATQPMSELTATSVVGMGNNEESSQFSANTITIGDFRIWNSALNAEQVAAL